MGIRAGELLACAVGFRAFVNGTNDAEQELRTALSSEVEILEIAAHHLNALTREFLSDVAIWIPRECAQFPALRKHVADDGSPNLGGRPATTRNCPRVCHPPLSCNACGRSQW